MMINVSIRLRLALGLAIAVILDTGVQFFWKLAVAGIPDTTSLWSTAEAMLEQPIIIFVAAMMVCQLVNWFNVLKIADLSFAKPITSLSYVTVSIVSFVFLNERLLPQQMIGIAIVIAGVWCVCRTDRISEPREAMLR